MEILAFMLLLLLAIPLFIFGAPVLLYVLPPIVVGLSINWWLHGRAQGIGVRDPRDRVRAFGAWWHRIMKNMFWPGQHFDT